jgi:hypothetical protein
MILNSAPENLATLGNVAQVSEFRIRNSAKAFGILSSGLYANKIRAIVRELSCNAVDSHVAAGVPDLAFDVHLPTPLRPYFSIRDYGTGLSHDQVLNIYTTYFESTKTNSNDFIGALGLGSKSPFSYTDNFTVIAIKDGKKGVYSAFINNDGVPAVAVMGQDDTEEPAGVEVKFAVTDRDDFRKFVYEAEQVYRYFTLKPNFTGAEATPPVIEYNAENIIPNVHQRKDGQWGRGSSNRAIMGNIEYPIELPRKNTDIDELSHIDNNSLDLFFEIGDLDFQASREGLQYTEKTIASIVSKYREISDVLAEKFAKETADIKNKWDLSKFVVNRINDRLWSTAARQYQYKHKLPFVHAYTHGHAHLTSIDVSIKDLEEKFNISVRAFTVDSGYVADRTSSEVKPSYSQTFAVGPGGHMRFVKNPENKKVWEQSKYHFKTQTKGKHLVWVLFAKDPAKPVLFKEFFKFIHNPPADTILEVTDLVKKEIVKKAKQNRKISTLRLAYRKGNYRDECVWEPYELDQSQQQTEINYYVPIKGYQAFNKLNQPLDIKKYYMQMVQSNKKEFQKIRVFGVRQDDIPVVESQSNWILLDDFLATELGKITKEDFFGMIIASVDKNNSRMYTSSTIMKNLDPRSPFVLFGSKATTAETNTLHYLSELCKTYAPGVDVENLKNEAKAEMHKIQQRYPMLTLLRGGYYDDPIVAEYIQFVDQHKGLN